MQENRSDDFSLVQSMRALREYFLNGFICLRWRHVLQPQCSQRLNQFYVLVFLRLLCLSRLWRGCSLVPPSVKQNWLSVDPAIFPPHFETNFLQRFIINWTVV